MRGYLWYKKRHLENALLDLNRSIILSPTGANAFSVRGRVLRDMKRLNEALADCDKALELEPTWYPYYATRAVVLEDLGCFDRAVADLKQQIEFAPETEKAKAHVTRAEFFHRRRQFEDEFSDWSEAIRLEPTLITARVNRGLFLVAIGEARKAIDDFDAAVALEPTRVDVLTLRGWAYLLTENVEMAEMDFDRAIRLDHDCVSARFYQACAWYQRKEFSNAIAGFTIAIAVKSDNPVYHLFRGIALLANGDTERANTDFSAAINLDSEYGRAYLFRGMGLERMGKERDAFADYERATQLMPRQPWSCIRLAWIQSSSPDASLLDGDRAVECATSACEWLNWSDSRALEALAAAQARKGNFELAVKYQERAELALSRESDAYLKRRVESLQTLVWERSIVEGTEEKLVETKKAIDHMTQACADTKWSNPQRIEILANAIARVGDRDRAVSLQNQAHRLTFDDAEFRCAKRLRLYQASKPCRDVDAAAIESIPWSFLFSK